MAPNRKSFRFETENAKNGKRNRATLRIPNARNALKTRDSKEAGAKTHSPGTEPGSQDRVLTSWPLHRGRGWARVEQMWYKAKKEQPRRESATNSLDEALFYSVLRVYRASLGFGVPKTTEISAAAAIQQQFSSSSSSSSSSKSNLKRQNSKRQTPLMKLLNSLMVVRVQRGVRWLSWGPPQNRL